MAEDDGDAVETVRWWLRSIRFEMGSPSGPPEWPLPGGDLNQALKVVQAADLLRTEFAFLPPPESKKAG